jgi:hypothetical protein
MGAYVKLVMFQNIFILIIGISHWLF